MSEKNLLEKELKQREINKINQEKEEDSEIKKALAEYKKIISEQKIKESFEEMVEWYNSKTEPPLIAEQWDDFSKDFWFHSKTIELHVHVGIDNTAYPYDDKFKLRCVYSYEKKEFKCAFWNEHSEGNIDEQRLMYSLNEIQDKARDWFVTRVQQPHLR